MSSLQETLNEHKITLPKIQVRLLEGYCEQLWSWNERLNLTRHTDYEKFVSRDLVDSLALSEFLREGERVLDVGTGGGVPGVVLAILRPDLKIELCDSTGKKALAVSEILREIRLDILVHHAKAETLLQEQGKRFTTLTVRAVNKMTPLLRQLAPCWSSFDRLLLVKGPNWVAERGEARHFNLMTKIALRCLKTYPIPVGGTETADSVILQLCLKENFDQLDKVIDEHKTFKKTAVRRHSAKKF